MRASLKWHRPTKPLASSSKNASRSGVTLAPITALKLSTDQNLKYTVHNVGDVVNKRFSTFLATTTRTLSICTVDLDLPVGTALVERHCMPRPLTRGGKGHYVFGYGFRPAVRPLSVNTYFT